VIYAGNNSQLAVSLFKKVKDVTASLDQETATPTSGKTRTGPAAAFPVYKNSFLSHLTLLFLLHSFPPNPTPRLQPFLTSRSKRSALRRRIGPSHKVLSLVVLDYEATPPGRSCLRASLGALCPTLLLIHVQYLRELAVIYIISTLLFIAEPTCLGVSHVAVNETQSWVCIQWPAAHVEK
jgi:hypothetical protein